MTSARELLNDLQKASHQGLLYPAYRSKKLAGVNQVEITFTNRVTIAARNNLVQYIRRRYNVQVWWNFPDVLLVQDYPNQ